MPRIVQKSNRFGSLLFLLILLHIFSFQFHCHWFCVGEPIPVKRLYFVTFDSELMYFFDLQLGQQ